MIKNKLFLFNKKCYFMCILILNNILMKDAKQGNVNLIESTNTNTEIDTPLSEPVTMKKVIYNLLPNFLNSFLYFFVPTVESHYIGETKDISLMDGVGLGILYNNIL